MNYYKWEIIVLPIPFTDLSSKKQRPCLIISNKKINDYLDDIIVLAITSNSNYSDKYSVRIDNKDLHSWMLPKVSYVKTNKVFTIHKNLIKKKVWILKKEIFVNIVGKFNSFIGD